MQGKATAPDHREEESGAVCRLLRPAPLGQALRSLNALTSLTSEPTRLKATRPR